MGAWEFVKHSLIVQYYLGEKIIAVLRDLLSKTNKSMCVCIVNEQQNEKLFILIRAILDEEIQWSIRTLQ